MKIPQNTSDLLNLKMHQKLTRLLREVLTKRTNNTKLQNVTEGFLKYSVTQLGFSIRYSPGISTS